MAKTKKDCQKLTDKQLRENPNVELLASADKMKLMANRTENLDYILRQLMTDNVRCDKNSVEDAHRHQQAHRYETFVEQASIHRLLLLEFGVGFNTPVIIRFPFERMVSQYSFHGPPSSTSTVTIHI